MNNKQRTNTTTRYFKIFVKNKGRPTLNLLEYLEQNIDIINEMGAKIRITKISDENLDKELVNNLANRGILRFPALVTDDNKVRLGVKKIMELFDSNKKKYQAWINSQAAAVVQPSEEQTVENFYRDEMSLKAMEKERNARDEEGFESGSSDDFNRRVSDQLKKRRIAPGGDTNTGNTDLDGLMERRRTRTETNNIARDNNHDNNRNDNNYRPAPAPQATEPLSVPRTDGNTAPGTFDDSMFDRAFTEGIGSNYY